METFTTKQAIDRAWHMLTRLLGVNLILASVAEKRDPSFVRRSGVHVIPDEENEKLGALAQILYDRNPSGFEGSEAHEMIAAASEKAGHPVKRPVTLGANGQYWHRGVKVDAPKVGG